MDQLISSCKVDLKKVPRRLVRRMDTFKASQSQKLWDEFCLFCFSKDECDPYLAQTSIVRDFLVEQFLSKDKFKKRDEKVLHPYIDFYTENIDGVCKQLNFYLKFCYDQDEDTMRSSEEVSLLWEVGDALDHREVPAGELGQLLTPPYWFAKYETEKHRKPFWRHGLVRRMLDDIDRWPGSWGSARTWCPVCWAGTSPTRSSTSRWSSTVGWTLGQRSSTGRRAALCPCWRR